MLTVGHTPEQDSEQVPQSWTLEAFEPERIERLVADLTPDDTVRGGRRYGVHIIEGADQHADIGRYIEWSVFEEFFDHDLNKMREEYQSFDPASTFLTVLDYEQQKPVGVIRIIKPSDKGLKSMNDLVANDSPWKRPGDTLASRFDEIDNDPEHTIDIATMAVMPAYRSKHAISGPSASLYSTCVQWSLVNNFNRWITIVDQNIYEMMQSWGEPFEPFAGTDFKPYLDSAKSLPVHTELHAALEKVHAFDEGIYQLYTKSAGLEVEFVLPELD